MEDYPDEESKVKLLGKTNIVQQDNTSAIQLECHGKKSSTKRTHHNISIRYFYCTSLLEDQTITEIRYQPTKELFLILGASRFKDLCLEHIKIVSRV